MSRLAYLLQSNHLSSFDPLSSKLMRTFNKKGKLEGRVFVLKRHLEKSVNAKKCSVVRNTFSVRELTTNTQFTNQFPVFDNIFSLKVFEKPFSLTDHSQQAAAGDVVFLVNVEVL